MDNPPALDLTPCELEPIHALGVIQPHGAFLAAEQERLTITHASANFAAVFGLAPATVLGERLASVIGDEAMAALMAGCPPPGMIGRSGFCQAPNGLRLHLHGFETSGLFGCDLEPATAPPPSPLLRLQALTEAFRAASHCAELCDLAVRALRELTGYHRVMAYRFAEDGHGEVIAEALTPGLEPYLGLHYPASDVPPQARLLYIEKPVGIIPDTEAIPSAILADSAWAAFGPLDLTRSNLRGISPRHLQYMRNMGCAAAMRIGLIQGNQLWGMLVCHHGSPLLPCIEQRAAAALIGKIAAFKLRDLTERELRNQRVARKASLTALLGRLAEPDPLPKILAGAQRELLGLVDAGGALIQLDGKASVIGETPPLTAARRIMAAMQPAAQGDVLAADNLALQFPALAGDAALGCGALLLPLTLGTADAILWFRPEQSRTVTWGGNPAEHAILEPASGQLGPRHSFAAWKETVAGSCAPWTEADRLLVREFRSGFAIAAAQRAIRELIRLRDYDPLTGLLKWEMIQQWFGASGRAPEARMALVIIDLGDLKELHATLGKAGGEALLTQLAQRLTRFVGPDSLAARHGEAEFILLSLGLAEPEVQARAGAIRQAIEEPYLVDGQPIRIVPNLRCAALDEAGGHDFASAADLAMASAKAAGAFQRKVESQRQKMEGLGRMIGGIAHEINNMLQPVTLLGQDMLDQDMVKPAARETLGIVLDCTRQARQIIGDLLAFSRPQGRSAEPLDPTELLYDTLRLVRQAIPPSINLTTEIQPGLPKILVNRTTFAQVLLNLATNAAAAMGNAGTLTVTLAEVREIMIGQAGRCMQMCVIDTGCGMGKETLERAFEPFFTTKQVGQGTGLGLPVVFGLVQEMSGSITLASEPGAGTIVTIRIPFAVPANA